LIKATNDYFLKKAQENTPEIQLKTVSSEQTVQILPDAEAFFGVKAVPSGKIPATVQTGDHFILDFGTHCVGHFSFQLEGTGNYLDAPFMMKLKFGEIPYEIARETSTYKGWLCPSWFQEEIIHVDEVGEISLPRRYAFRYVEITILATPRVMKLSNFQAVCETSAEESNFTPLPAGTDPFLAEIDKVSAATLRDCMQTAYEDGPKRDHRLWSGDLRLQALSDQVLFHNDKLARRCLYLFAACEENGEYLPGCLYQYPFVAFDKEMAIMDYAMAWVCALADYFENTKDLETLKDLYPVCCGQMEVALSHIGPDGIIEPTADWGGGFLDWVEGLQHNIGIEGCLLYTLENILPLATAMRDQAHFSLWENALVSGRKASKELLYDEKKKAFISEKDHYQYSIHAQIWMILGGVLSKKEGQEVLLKAASSKDCLQPVTPLAHHYYMEALLKLDMKAEALSHLKSFWGKMVLYGADTYWEAFVDGHPEVSPYDDNLMNSFCHAWGCSASYFIRKFLL